MSVLHSTPWGHEPDGGLVLTYAVVPDPDPTAPAATLVDASVVSSGDPLQPQPADLLPQHVVAHAVRHLAELARRDPAVAAAAHRRDQALQELVRRVGDALPTRSRDELRPAKTGELQGAGHGAGA